MSAPGLVEVRLREIPVPLWTRAKQQSDELLREFALASIGEAEGEHLPTRLTALMAALTETYGDRASAQEDLLFEAAATGRPVVDELIFEVPAAVAGACVALGDLLDEADDYCRAGEHLLTLAASPDTVAFRRWYLAEFVRQVDGEPAVAWPAYDGWWPRPA